MCSGGYFRGLAGKVMGIPACARGEGCIRGACPEVQISDFLFLRYGNYSSVTFGF